MKTKRTRYMAQMRGANGQWTSFYSTPPRDLMHMTSDKLRKSPARLRRCITEKWDPQRRFKWRIVKVVTETKTTLHSEVA